MKNTINVLVFWKSKQTGRVEIGKYNNVIAIEPKDCFTIIHTTNEDYENETSTFSNNSIISIQFE